MKASILLAVAVSLFAFACSSSDDDDSSSSVNIATCGGQIPSGALITPAIDPNATATKETGGVIADGTYQLSAVRVVGNAALSDGATYSALKGKETLEVSNGQWRIAYHYEGLGNTIDGVHAGTYTYIGGTLGGKETCDAGDARNGIGGFLRPFTASPTSLDIFQDDAREIVFTYQKQ